MSQVSKRSVAKDIEEKMRQILWDSFSSLRRSKDAELFLSDLLTPTEKTVLSKRLSIAVLLSKGYNNEDIMTILKVSSATVAKIKTCLHLDSGGYKLVLNKLLRRDALKELLQGIEKTLLDLHPYKKHPRNFRPKKGF